MPPVAADPTVPPCVLAPAIARHPAGWKPRFRPLVRQLTGSWRVTDPGGFAAALTGADELAGHPVVDLQADAGGPGRWPELLAGAARRLAPAVRWVSAVHAEMLLVEARAEAPAGPAGPELFAVAHLVEPLGPGLAAHGPGPDGSWMILVAGDGAGGVAGIARVLFFAPGSPPRSPAAACLRLPLRALRAALVIPALEATDRGGRGAAVLPFRGRRR